MGFKVSGFGFRVQRFVVLGLKAVGFLGFRSSRAWRVQVGMFPFILTVLHRDSNRGTTKQH